MAQPASAQQKNEEIKLLESIVSSLIVLMKMEKENQDHKQAQ